VVVRDRLASARGFVFDMDGTLVLGDRTSNGLRPLPGALEAACQAVWDGAELYSCSQTPFFAVAGGRALGTSRAISAMIRSLTGCTLQVVGKPSLDALRTAADRLGFPAAQLAVVGDDPHLEVPMALRGRALGIAVGTGLGGSVSYDGLPLSRRPHLQVRGVDELLEMLAGWC
jgi:NagD protein